MITLAPKITLVPKLTLAAQLSGEPQTISLTIFVGTLLSIPLLFIAVLKLEQINFRLIFFKSKSSYQNIAKRIKYQYKVKGGPVRRIKVWIILIFDNVFDTIEEAHDTCMDLKSKRQENIMKMYVNKLKNLDEMSKALSIQKADMEHSLCEYYGMDMLRTLRPDSPLLPVRKYTITRA